MQAGLELLGNPLASVLSNAGLTEMSHHAQQLQFSFKPRIILDFKN